MTVARHEQPDEAGDFLLLEGDVRECLRSLEPGSVDAVVTSPPYWSLRDYGLEPAVWGGDPSCEHEWGEEGFVQVQSGNFNEGLNERTGRSPGELRKQERGLPHEISEGQFCTRELPSRLGGGRCGAWRGQLGLEPTPELYVAHIVEVFREVRRVLAPHGACWLNIGDSYARDANKGQHKPGDSGRQGYVYDTGGGRASQAADLAGSGLKAKDLVMIPASTAIALRADGWWLRGEVVWEKPNAMTSSVKDRPGCAHEMVYLLAKGPSYFYDRYAVRVPYKPDGRKQTRVIGTAAGERTHENYENREGGERWPDQDRAVRSVWTIATQPFSASWLGFDDDDHFATFPEDFAERCVKLIVPREVCTRCGRPRERVVERGELVGYDRGGNYRGRDDIDELVNRMESEVEYRPGMSFEARTVGWSECGCSRGLEPDDLELVLTPTGENDGAEDPSLTTGRAGRNRPRNAGEGTRPITRYEQRRYAEQLRELRGTTDGARVFARLELEAGVEAMAHYLRVDRAGARPIPPFRLESWIEWRYLKRVELPPAREGSYRRGVVLDPFAGSGTVAVVARRGGRGSVGCEAHPRYARIALARAAQWWRKPTAPSRGGHDADQLSLV